MARTIKDAMTTKEGGLKVIIADGECMLAVQRKKKPADRKALAGGQRVIKAKFGIDDAVCTGDHSCVRLSGCPSLTIQPSGDPLKVDPVAHINQGCVACGLCGENAHAAVLCPSFYRAEIVQNPKGVDRFMQRLNNWVLGLFGISTTGEAK